MKKILVVDDNETNLKILSLILKNAEYEPICVRNPMQVCDSVIELKPALILLDINMPGMDGMELCFRLKENPRTATTPVIFVSALSDADTIVKGFSLGAVDYITKPYRTEEVKARIATHIKICDLKEELERSNQILGKKVEEQVQLITDMQMETIFSLAKLAQSRDDDTGKHLERVQRYCYLLANQLKYTIYKDDITEDFIQNLVNACTLHDIGKVGISDLILLKPGKFTDEEYEIMKTHTIIGAETLEEVDKKFGNNAFINMGKVIARSHHERWDGLGYPDKLKREQIPLPARIMAIADVYDALSTKRIYKDPYSQEKCVEIIKEGSGTQFDPIIVEAFLQITDAFYNVRAELEDAKV